MKQSITNYVLLLLFRGYNPVSRQVSSNTFKQSPHQSYYVITKLKQEQDSYSFIMPAGPNSKAFASMFSPSQKNNNAFIWTS